ncbi:MAG: hypothetical protein ABI818_20935 [Acidobacteriota bacterium]
MTSADRTRPDPVSATQLAIATAAALAGAVIILAVAVLPAEYGIDPLRTGAALGLLRSLPTEVANESAAAAPSGTALKPEQHGASSKYSAPYHVDRAQFVLGPYQYIEYKYQLAQGATMVFAWEASAPVIHDFHGAPEEGGADAEVSIDKATRSRASGSLAAPFAGMHGWYWENPGGTSITITMTSAGFYNAAIEYRSNHTRHVHELARPTAGVDAPER